MNRLSRLDKIEAILGKRRGADNPDVERLDRSIETLLNPGFGIPESAEALAEAMETFRELSPPGLYDDYVRNYTKIYGEPVNGFDFISRLPLAEGEE